MVKTEVKKIEGPVGSAIRNYRGPVGSAKKIEGPAVCTVISPSGAVSEIASLSHARSCRSQLLLFSKLQVSVAVDVAILSGIRICRSQ